MTLRELELLYQGRKLAEQDKDRERHIQAYLNREIMLKEYRRGKEFYKYRSFDEFYQSKESKDKDNTDTELLELIRLANSR